MKDRPDLPLYLRIADELRAKLRTMPLDAPFDTEQSLTEAYGVSRGTIRQALGVLEREGLLSRSQGRGSFRAMPSDPLYRMHFSENMTYAVRKVGNASEISHLSITLTAPPPDVGELLNIPRGPKVRGVSRVRTVNGEPFAYCLGYVRTDLVPPFFKRDFSTSLSDLVQNTLRTHIESKRLKVLAAVADRTAAEALSIPIGSPVLKMCFLYRAFDGEPMLVDVLYFPHTQALQFEFSAPNK